MNRYDREGAVYKVATLLMQLRIRPYSPELKWIIYDYWMHYCDASELTGGPSG